MRFSKRVAKQVSDVVLDRFKSLALDAEYTTQIFAGFYPELGPITLDNKPLVLSMLNVIKYDQNFSDFYVGLPNGSFLGVFNQPLYRLKMIIANPLKPIPEGTAFFIRFMDRSKNPPLDHWVYLNENFQVLLSEVSTKSTYDSRLRPWYHPAIAAGGLYWTGIYKFSPSAQEGLTVANPSYYPNGELAGVVAVDLSLTLLSKFLYEQKIGKSGKAFILDRDGKIIVPESISETSKTAIASVYDHYETKPGIPGFVIKSNGNKYLAYITELPVVFGHKWLIAIIAPLDDFLGETILIQREVLLIIIGILILSSLVILYFAKRISNPIATLAQEINKISELKLDSNVRVESNIKEIHLIDSAIAAMRRAISSFARYVPKQIVKDLFRSNEEIVLGGKKKEVTIFFSDIRGFTSVAEAYPIDVLLPLLSEYFNEMTKIILELHGTVDKFLGDGIMAFWGAPIQFSDHATRACLAALKCKAMLTEMNKKRKEQNKPEFITRFGINTGTVIVGNIGTEDRMDYTVIGDAVNITSRLQDIDKVYHTAIIISQDTYSRLDDSFFVRPLDVVAVKGKKEKIKIYELIGKTNEGLNIEPSSEEIELCRMFKDAFEVFERNDFKQAQTLFTAIHERFPDDYPTQLYLQRILKEFSH